MFRNVMMITKTVPRCLTARIHSPNDYPPVPESRRMRFISPRFRLVSSRRKVVAWVGLVLWRALGGSHACWMSRTNRFRAAWRLRSWERYWRASMINIPSDVSRLPASLIKRCFTSCGKEGEFSTLNRNWTAEDTLLTFCPPGPGERMKANSISPSPICISGEISIIQ
jgi:hypothetical protein